MTDYPQNQAISSWKVKITLLFSLCRSKLAENADYRAGYMISRGVKF
jgi:hypothetical protein